MKTKYKCAAAAIVSAAAILGAQSAQASILWENFDAGIPGSWSVIDNEGNGVIWTNIAGSGEAGNFTNGSGDAASVSSDLFGQAEFDTELRTPVFSLPASSDAWLNYTANYQNFAFLDFLDVDISTDSGASWANLLSWNEDHGGFRTTPGEDVHIDLTPYLGLSGLVVRWRYYDPNTGDDAWYAQIDNVHINVPEPGPLALFGIGLAGLGLVRRRRVI